MKKVIFVAALMGAVLSYASLYDVQQMVITQVTDSVSTRREVMSEKKISGEIKAVYLDFSGLESYPTATVSVVAMTNFFANEETLFSITATADGVYYPVKECVFTAGDGTTNWFDRFGVLQQHLKLSVTNNNSTNVTVGVNVLYERR